MKNCWDAIAIAWWNCSEGAKVSCVFKTHDTEERKKNTSAFGKQVSFHRFYCLCAFSVWNHQRKNTIECRDRGRKYHVGKEMLMWWQNEGKRCANDSKFAYKENRRHHHHHSHCRRRCRCRHRCHNLVAICVCLALSLSHSHAKRSNIVKQRAHMGIFCSFCVHFIWLHNWLSKRCEKSRHTSHASTHSLHTITAWAADETAQNKYTRKRTISRAHISTNRNWPCVFMFRAGVCIYIQFCVRCVPVHSAFMSGALFGDARWMEQARPQHIAISSAVECICRTVVYTSATHGKSSWHNAGLPTHRKKHTHTQRCNDAFAWVHWIIWFFFFLLLFFVAIHPQYHRCECSCNSKFYFCFGWSMICDWVCVLIWWRKVGKGRDTEWTKIELVILMLGCFGVIFHSIFRTWCGSGSQRNGCVRVYWKPIYAYDFTRVFQTDFPMLLYIRYTMLH